MPDLLDLQHINAGLDLLRADAGLVVYPDAQGFTPDLPAAQYVRAYATIERPADAFGNSLAGVSQQWTVRWYLHCIGGNENSSIAVAMRVRDGLLDKRPVIAGRNCGLIREDQAMPPTKDDSTGLAVFDSQLVYRLTTT
jgi:hypothetical protein